MNFEVLYNRIWSFVLTVLAKAGINFDTTKLPEWLNVPQA